MINPFIYGLDISFNDLRLHLIVIFSVGEKTEALVGKSTCPRSHNPGKNPGATLRLRRAFPTLR